MLIQDLIANIKPNPRNGELPDVYFDEELYKIGLRLSKPNNKKYDCDTTTIKVIPQSYFFKQLLLY